MYIEGGVLYTHRSMRDPEFMLARTPQEQAEYLKPTPHSLFGARCKFEVHRSGPTMAVGVAVGPVLPIIPVGVKKAFLVTVVLADGSQLVGWTPTGKAALRFYKAVNKAGQSPNHTQVGAAE